MAKRRLFGWLILPDLSWLHRTISIKALLISAVVVAAFAGSFVAIGGVPIAANSPDSWLTRNVLHFTFKRSIAASAREIEPPKDFSSEGRVKLGARLFDMVCANCHGAPGLGQSAVALSMSPRPQHLPRVLGQFSDAELYKIVRDGVKFSAMPSWPTDTRGDEVWSMVAFLKQVPTMDAATYRSLTAAREPSETSPGFPLANNFALRPSDTGRMTPPVNEFLYAAPAIGFGDRTLQTHPVAVCAGCHGVNGDGTATNGEAPNLTIHDAPYLQRALDAYSKGERKSGFMQEIASQLSSEQIRQLADYYAQLPVHTSPPAQTPDTKLLQRGEEIARNGIPASATAACANCHESTGTKLSGAPRIAGQTEPYLRRQLTAMRSGGRGFTGPWYPMYAEAHNLSDSDIAGLAAFYSSQKPTKGSDAPLMSAAWPRGDLARGQLLFDRYCTKCHLNGGRGDEEGLTPDITLLVAPYVAQQLHSFRTRDRVSNKMLETTQSLTYDDMASMASYLNTLAPQKALAPVNTAAAARGAALAEKGDASRNLPACLSCHNAEGVAALPLISRLQGQSAPYLKNRLDLFANWRDNSISGLNPMPAIAEKLTETERADLAAYFAAAAPLAKPAAAETVN